MWPFIKSLCPLVVITGRTTSGFYTVDETLHTTRLYRVSGQQTLAMNACPLSTQSLDHRYVFIVDAGRMIYIWTGKKSTLMLRSKARLVAEKMNKNERKGSSEIVTVAQGGEEPEFWAVFGGQQGAEIKDSLQTDIEYPRPVLYKVGLGMGYLELPQVRHRDLIISLLVTLDRQADRRHH